MKRGRNSRFDFLNIRKKRLKSNRSAQLQIGFSMIFSIILIVAFIAVAIYAIMVFLRIKGCADTGLFKDNLQNEIDRAWSSEESSSVFSESLSPSIEKVCFIDLLEQGRGEFIEEYDKFKKYGYQGNLFFYPIKNACEGLRAFDIKHINIKEITQNENPYCVKNVNGKIELRIEKSFYDALVKIEKVYASSEGNSNEEFECPAEKTINCMPIVPPERANLCSGDYHEWIKRNCNVQFAW